MDLQGITKRKKKNAVEEMPIKAPALKINKPIYYTYEDFPIEDLMIYGGIDCIVTTELAGRLNRYIYEEPEYVWIERDVTGKRVKRKDKLMSIAESYEKYTAKAHEFIMDLEVNGIKYDVELNKILKSQLEMEIAELERLIWVSLPGINFNLDSGQQLGHYLYEVRGFEVNRRTKTGEPSTDGEAIKELAIRYPEEKIWLEPLAKRGDLSSIYRTFVSTYVEDFVKRDGRIHASYSLHGTGSFRIAGDSPNLTQLPRPKHGYDLRRMFTVSRGNIFMAFDFSSAEVKILGALCKDENLLKSIREGLDFHSFSASHLFNIPYEQFIYDLKHGSKELKAERKEQRQVCKVLTFSIIYGSSAGGIAGQLNVTKERAQELLSLYFKLYPGIKVYIDNTHDMAKENHMVVTPFGQRKREFGAMSIFEETAVYNGCLRNAQNVRVQSTTSTFGMMCFAQLNEAIKPLGAKSLCTVYDSIEIEVPLAVAAEVLELAFLHLNDYPVEIFDWLDLSVGVDAEIGLNWGDAVHVERGITQTQIETMYERTFK